MAQLKIPYSAAVARSGPLAFGHANIVRAITLDDDPTRLTLAMVFDVPGAPPGRVAGWIRLLVERHESLRTTYSSGDTVTQHVSASGEVTAEVVDGGGDPLAVAEQTAKRLRAKPFDLAGEHPMRIAVVVRDGAASHLVWVVTHAAMDVAACELLLGEWTELTAGHDLPPDAAPQPLDVAELEKTPAVERLTTASLKYWESKLRSVPQAMFPLPHQETSFLRPGLRIRSTAAMSHVAAIADRTSASASAIVLAAVKALVAYRSALPMCVTTSLSGNRVLRQLRRFFGSMAQDALLPVSIPDTFDELVLAVRAASVPAYRHSWFAPDAIWEVITRACAERGMSFARDLVFNDMSALGEFVPGTPPRAAHSRLPAVWIPGGPDLGTDEPRLDLLPEEDIPCRFFGCLYRLDTELDLTLWVSPLALDEKELTEFGRALLAVLRAAAEGNLPVKDLARLTTLAPVEHGEGWVLSDSCWVELAAVRELVSGVLGDRPHLLTAEPDAKLGHKLVCHVSAPADPAVLQAACVAALPGRVTALAPHEYVVHSGPQWTPETVVGIATGREGAA